MLFSSAAGWGGHSRIHANVAKKINFQLPNASPLLSKSVILQGININTLQAGNPERRKILVSV